MEIGRASCLPICYARESSSHGSDGMYDRACTIVREGVQDVFDIKTIRRWQGKIRWRSEERRVFRSVMLEGAPVTGRMECMTALARLFGKGYKTFSTSKRSGDGKEKLDGDRKSVVSSDLLC